MMVASNRIVSIFMSLVLTGLVRGACDKSVVIDDPAALDAIKECKSFFGNITITNKFTGPVALPALEKVSGNLHIFSSSVNSVVLPRLTEAMSFTLQYARLDKLHLNLTKVYGLTLDHLVGDFPVEFTPGLESSGVVKITDNLITSVKGLKFKELSQLEVVSNTQLKSFDLPNLKSCKGLFSFQGNVQASLYAPKLVDIKGQCIFTKVHNLDLSKLTSVSQMFKVFEAYGKDYSFPELQSAHGGVLVEHCPTLESLKFPNLQGIASGGFNLNNDPKLNVVEIPKLVNVDGGFIVSVPTLTDFKINNDLTSKAGAEINSNVNCSTMDKLKTQFGTFKCEKSKEVVVPSSNAPSSPSASQTPENQESPSSTTTPASSKKSSDALSSTGPAISALALLVLTLF